MSRKRKTIKEKFCFRKSKLLCAHKISSLETIFLYKSSCVGLIGFIQLLYFSKTDPFLNGLSCPCRLFIVLQIVKRFSFDVKIFNIF